MRTLLAILLVSSVAFADVGLRNAGVVVGPVTAIDCTVDGGLVCSRTASTAIGSMRCASAGVTIHGCVTTGNQVLNGNKTLDGGVMINGPLWVDGGVFVGHALTVDAGVVALTTFTSYAASGAAGVSIATNGARIYHGATSFSAVPTSGDTNGPQFSGSLAVTDYFRSIGRAHASLPACSSTIKSAAEFCTTHNEWERCNGTAWAQMDADPPVMLGSVQTDGNPWSGSTTRGLLGKLSRDWTVTHISSLFASGTGGGTNVFIIRGVSPQADGGTCSCNVGCSVASGACPDAGALCSLPCAGQCTFGANEDVLALGQASGCESTQPSSININVYGVLGTSSN